MSDKSTADLLTIRNLSVRFHTRQATLHAVRNLSISLRPGEILGLVGESGCGKSVTAQAIMRLIGDAPGEHVTGEIEFRGTDLLRASERAMTRLRGNKLAMIFQDPMTALNPALRVGEQIAECLRWHRQQSRQQAAKEAIRLLERVGIPDSVHRARQYPHEFSGGMRQRVVIAIALCCEPDLLIADEPTTALDATLQTHILDLLNELRAATDATMILITHDLNVVARVCDRVAVMYAGALIETAPTQALLASSQHPYTHGLINSLPRIGRKERLQPIPGQPPDPAQQQTGCLFADRCPHVHDRCGRTPPLFQLDARHQSACWLADKKESA